ncbi:MAG: response regulator [Syntrophaceae bacterium]|nr:response regulator [Syntrophaceae bacterium]
MSKNLKTEHSKYTILVVDDEQLIRDLIASFLAKLGHTCITATDGVDALNQLKEKKVDAVITDIKMPNMDGIMLTGELSSQYSDLPVMVMTAFDEEYSAGIAISIGAREFIKKPFSLDEFAIRLHKMINDSEAIKRLKRKEDGEEDLQELMEELEQSLKKG